MNGIWGDVSKPGSVAGGLAAVRAAEAFFAGLPGRDSGTPPVGGGGDTPPTSGGDTAPAGGGGTPAPVSGNTPPAGNLAPPATKPQGTVIAKVKAPKVAGAVVKAPTRAKAGTYKVTITAAAGRAAASGKVTLVLKKGKLKKTVTGTIAKGVATLKVPKLAKGTWKVTISWVGDTSYLDARVSGASVKVRK